MLFGGGGHFLLNTGKIGPGKLVSDLTAPLPVIIPLRNDIKGLKEHPPKCDPVVVRKRN